MSLNHIGNLTFGIGIKTVCLTLKMLNGFALGFSTTIAVSTLWAIVLGGEVENQSLGDRYLPNGSLQIL